ncbi:MAG: hypothetical protein KDC98_19165 [Planctomycetes bacterium]|nr:hypothetical protein [Planctomycetota bacterium]
MTVQGLRCQCPPGAVMPRDLTTLSATPTTGSPAAVRWQLGKKAIEAGQGIEAQKHLLQALQLHPCSPAILLDLVRAAGTDVDQSLLWGERYVRAATDDHGRLKLDRDARKLLSRDGGLDAAQKLAAARAQAIAEVARLIDKQRPAKRNMEKAQFAGFGSELLLLLGQGAPSPLGAVAARVDAIRESLTPDYEVIFEALLQVMRAAPPAKADPIPFQDRAIRAARILAGLARQSAFKDLKGPPPPDMTAIGATAREFLAGLDGAVQQEAKVWTIAELEALSPEDRERFTAEHDTWRHPGVAVSETGRYRIETICGHGTLLGCARTVELHHQRLVAHFGVDPFLERQGTIRIVPENSGLETEGVPFWWAAGFQGGDRTTVRFAWSSIPALGKVLTHELTHRFDSVLRPFLRSWYVEGHAVWTAAHYGHMTDTGCVENFLATGSVDAAWRKGYGRRDKLEQLLRGEIEEYRDNYPVGYSLYAYLRSFPPGQSPRFGDALARFEKNARGGQKDPVGYFTKTFCDGRDGRPASFEEFLQGWQAFLDGVGNWLAQNRDESNRWVAAYGGIEGESGREVEDRPTWSWARTRAEPFFGQDHAALATLLLAEAGLDEAVMAAGLWSITVDGWRPDTVLRSLAAARAVATPAAAQAFASSARSRFPALPATAASPLAKQLPRTIAFVTALGERATELAAAGAPLAAAALAAEHDAIAVRLDLPALAAVGQQSLAAAAPPAVPTHLDGYGWAESSLTGFDERRVPGLWYAEPSGDLHVGREKPRDGTGSMDRVAQQRHAFVHTVSWQSPGAYVLRGRVHFTTAYASGAIVFGHARRDRDLRLHFTAGDFNYAVGRRTDNRKFGRVHFSLAGLWERDGKLPETALSFNTEIIDEAAWFDYELVVRGPRVLIRINDDDPQAYAVHDGSPIEGHVGFAMSMGAIRVQDPTVQRLDRPDDAELVGLDLQRQPLLPLEELMALPTRGIPTDANGTIVLLVPTSEDAAEEFTGMALPRAMGAMSGMLTSRCEYPQPWVIAFPAGLAAVHRESIQRQVREVRGEELATVEHRVAAPFTGTYPWVLFVDGLGVLRAAAEVNDPRFFSRVHRWSRMFRPR